MPSPGSPAFTTPVQIDWAKATRLIAAEIQSKVSAIDNAAADDGGLDGDGLRPRFLMTGEKPPESCRMWVHLVAVDPLPVESQNAPGHAHTAKAVVSLTCAVRERDAAVDYLLLERLVSPVCQLLRGPALIDGDTLIDALDDPDIQHDGEPDPQTGFRTCGVTLVMRVRRSAAAADAGLTFETPQPSAA
jgi:hypothetical protein